MLELDERIDPTLPIYDQAERLRRQDSAEDSASAICDVIRPHLAAEDDPELWQVVLRNVLLDATQQNTTARKEELQFLRIGSCSHWFRPHQARWTAGGGFAWPSGWHGVRGHSLHGLPELDWSLLFERTRTTWMPAEKYRGKSRVEIRVSIPARTARHPQAAIHTLWSPANERVFYGFRKKEDGWKLAARSEFYSDEG